ncbi:MAG: Gfo/Idh/MocA family oxidoreductase, partial [Armatimonadota bacterium]
MRKVKAGIIGTGFIGPAHVEAARRLGFVEMAALAEADQATADAKAAMLSIPKAYGNYKDMLADPSIEVVHLCTPNTLHYPQAKEALQADKHVFCEKPLAMSSEESAELVALAKQTGKINAVDFNYRFYPLNQEARSRVQSGECGQPLVIMGSYLQDWLLLPTDYNWRIEPSAGGESRAVADVGSH